MHQLKPMWETWNFGQLVHGKKWLSKISKHKILASIGPAVTPSPALVPTPASTPTPALVTKPSSPTRLQQPSEDAISRVRMRGGLEGKSTKLAPDGIVRDEIFTTAVRLIDITMRNKFAGASGCMGNFGKPMEYNRRIAYALNMHAEERENRHHHNFLHVTTHTSHEWAETVVKVHCTCKGK
ncbi:hypothetical protein Tco_0422133 [Tanacetum coccineum]